MAGIPGQVDWSKPDAKLEYDRLYYRKNADVIKKRAAEWAIKNADRRKARNKEYWKFHGREQYLKIRNDPVKWERFKEGVRRRSQKPNNQATTKARAKRNREKILIWAKQWKLRHIDQVRREAREYAKNKPHILAQNNAKRRARCQDPVDPSEKRLIQNLFREAKSVGMKTCHYCGLSFFDVAHVDHIIPVSRGGEHKRMNMCLSCGDCNLKKGNKTLSEWEPDFTFFN